tara:strand:+ start:697 stop:1431 length:735 start_codon:yes stop_codon:yes gene_type:complete
MAGLSRSFCRSKFKMPRWQVTHHGLTLLSYALAGLESEKIMFVCREDHYYHGGLKELIDDRFGHHERTKVILCKDKTAGQATTAIYSSEYVGGDDPVIVLSPDQVVDWNYYAFLKYVKGRDADAAVVVSSAVRTSASLFNVSVNEKKSTVKRVGIERRDGDYSSCGIYYFKYGSDMIRYCRAVVEKGIRHKGEYWFADSLNEAIQQGGKHPRKLVVPYFAGESYMMNKPNDMRVFQKRDPEWSR